MKTILKKMRMVILVGVLMACGVLLNNDFVRAEGYGLTLSPMNQSIIVDPDDSREVSFLVSNPASSSVNARYELSVEPFYIDEDGSIYYKAEGESAEMIDWITFDVPTTGEIAPNESKTISFTVNVPKSAPAGGQYIAIIITLNSGDEEGDTSGTNSGAAVSIKEVKRMAHLVYAEITGNTSRRGEILDASVPSFLLSGKMTGSSTIKNTGNVHGTAKYTLQVYPLFSDEEVFSNVENPETKRVLPNRSLYKELAWEETPSIGIFNVVYTVEFEGSTAEVSKMVIICPIWLLLIIFFVIIAIMIYLVVWAKKFRGGGRKHAEVE